MYDVLDILLQDKSAKKNIICATDAYTSHGDSCSDKSLMFPEAFNTGNPVVLMTRSEKEGSVRTHPPPPEPRDPDPTLSRRGPR